MFLDGLVPAPGWLNSGDTGWQLTAATLVGIQSVPGLAILYAGLMKRKVVAQLGADGPLRIRDDLARVDALELQHELWKLRPSLRPGHHRCAVAGQLRLD